MIPLDLKNRRVTVAGLGKFGGGIGVARWLVGRGARVLVTDKAPAEKLLESIHKLDGLPIEFVLGEHRAVDFTDTDLVVTSLAVPPSSEFLSMAQSKSVPITTEIALFVERCKSRIVGVTGTKGKSTTSKLIELMIATKHVVHLGGNIGGSLLDELSAIRENDVVVLELSSFMLYWLGKNRWSPNAAVLTMIGQDHLDWHETLEAYRDAKAQIVLHQQPNCLAFAHAGHPVSVEIARRTPAEFRLVSDDPSNRLDLKIAGVHNQHNGQLAVACAMSFGVDRDSAMKSVRDFAGLPHRLQLVHESNGVRFIDDSIATVPESAIAACLAFERGSVIQIVGGSDKGNDVTSMARVLAERCRAVLGIGFLGQSIVDEVRKVSGFEGCCAEYVETLENAIARARTTSREGDVVLLSTGCASYDQFTNFEARGNRFAELARVS